MEFWRACISWTRVRCFSGGFGGNYLKGSEGVSPSILTGSILGSVIGSGIGMDRFDIKRQQGIEQYLKDNPERVQDFAYQAAKLYAP